MAGPTDSDTTQQRPTYATLVSFGKNTKSTHGHPSWYTFSTSSTGTYSPKDVLNMFFFLSTIFSLPFSQRPISPV